MNKKNDKAIQWITDKTQKCICRWIEAGYRPARLEVEISAEQNYSSPELRITIKIKREQDFSPEAFIKQFDSISIE